MYATFLTLAIISQSDEMVYILACVKSPIFDEFLSYVLTPQEPTYYQFREIFLKHWGRGVEMIYKLNHGDDGLNLLHRVVEV
jgi:hypothetical protein